VESGGSKTNLGYLFQVFLDQFTPIAAFLAISSFIYVGLGRSRMFQVHPIPRLVLSVIIGLYSANSFDFGRIIGIAAFAVTTGIIIMLVWHVLLARGKPQSIQVLRTGDPAPKIQEDLLRKLLELVFKK
jgi:hypothetical protein